MPHLRLILLSGPAGGTTPTLIPNADNLPGAQTLKTLADGIDGWALIAAMIGIVVGAILWGCTQ